MPAAPLALCGNVFPAESVAELRCALRGPVAEWTRAVHAGGGPARPGFGLYLAAAAAAELRADAAARAALAAVLAASGLEVWTANAFPYGGFHAARVKERAFLPDWTDPARLSFTLDVAALLCELAPEGRPLSLSTCPLGYGPDARVSDRAREHLLRARDALDAAAARRGAPVTLALEPEPDGAFERVSALAAWLAALEGDRPPSSRRLGVCWDLCHGAVVGERHEDAIAAIAATGTPLGKVQVSAALGASGPAAADLSAQLRRFAGDPYLHQVRGRGADGTERRWPDLPDFLRDPAAAGTRDLRVHCHVPLHCSDFGSGLRGTEWRAAAADAHARGWPLEVETYTWPVLPAALREGRSVPELLALEYLACVELLRA